MNLQSTDLAMKSHFPPMDLAREMENLAKK